MGVSKEQKHAKRTGLKGSADKRRKVPFNEFRFVRVELTEKEKGEFRSLLEAGEFDTIPIDEFLERGLKLSVSRDFQNGSVVASLTAQYTDCSDAGQVLTAHGRDAVTALAVLTYKDRYLAGEDGWSACEARRGGSYSDIG